MRAVRFAEVVVVLLDVEIPFEQQDLRIADFAETEGRAVVVAVNKWDLEDEKTGQAGRTEGDVRPPAAAAARARRWSRSRPRPAGASTGCTTRSARPMTSGTAGSPTAQLNTWLGAMTEAHPPPAPGGHRIKLRYMTQVKTRPPGFVDHVLAPDELPESYKRYLVNGLRDHFDMPGTPIRLFFRGPGRRRTRSRTEVPHALPLRKHKEKNTGQ